MIPGKLNVSRTIGDLNAKKEKFGGLPNVIICDPEIKHFIIKDHYDFIFLGCFISQINFLFYFFIGDGIYDKLSNKKII